MKSFPDGFILKENEKRMIKMSVVLAACNSEYALMMADSRMCRISEEGRMEPIDEDFEKIKQVNNKVGVGFAGDAVGCSLIMRNLETEQKPHYYVEDVVDILHRAATNYPLGQLKIHFIVCGLNSEAQMQISAFSSVNGFQVETTIPIPPYIQPKCALPFKNSNFTNSFIEENVNMPLKSAKSDLEMQQCFINAIKKVASLDSSVNTKIRGIQLTRTQIMKNNKLPIKNK